MLRKHYNNDREILPVLYYVSAMTNKDYSPLLEDKLLKRKGVPYSEYADEFEGYVAETLAEMFDLDRPFEQCEDAKSCSHCDFVDICARRN